MSFTSHAQNFEDVMLWRALADVLRGFYIDVGAGDPDSNSVTRAFYERGWSGVNIEPEPGYFQLLTERRPRDITLPIALADSAGERRLNVPAVPGLATLDSATAFQHRARGIPVRRIRVAVQTLAEICHQHAAPTIHFLNVDAQGAEALVLQGADFTRFRPWIVLAQATVPLTRAESHLAWEPILRAAEYRFAWFDGLNRFYLAAEHHAALSPHFRMPPNCFDGFRLADAQKDAMAAELGETKLALAESQAARAAAEAALATARERTARLQAAVRQAADAADAAPDAADAAPG
jgi:FkbM family methyltransferase